MTARPFLSCLCPTYRRPKLLENAIACWLAQDYPADRRELIIIDDANQIAAQYRDGWYILPRQERFASLPEKYNVLALSALPETDIFAVWEDDDIYLPHHISAHVAAIQAGARWSKPSSVLSTYTGRPELEGAAGRFFASIAVTRSLWEEAGGIVRTKRADFDQQMLARLTAIAGPPADPLSLSPCLPVSLSPTDQDKERGRHGEKEQTAAAPLPGYCFRWGSTANYHGQGQMRIPDDETWYDRCADQGDPAPVAQLNPQLDSETQAVYRRFAP